MNLRLTAALLGLSTLALGCDDAAYTEAGSSPRGTGTITYTAGWGCRDCTFKNSPWLGGYPVPAMGHGPFADSSLAQIVEAYDLNGKAWPVAFDQGALIVKKNGVAVMGDDLIGYRLLVKIPGKDTFEIDIYAYRDVEDWTDASDPIPTYGLSLYLPAVDAWVNLCPGQDLDETSIVFIENETYDLHDPGVGAASSAQDTVTLGCRGHALAKMKLLGYEPTSPFYASTAEERVATLRMVTADYCGIGTSNTQFGTKLDWTDAAGHVQHDPTTMGSVLEAEWDADGAICFMQPRIQGTVPPCGLPECDAEEYGTPSAGALWTSIIP